MKGCRWAYVITVEGVEDSGDVAAQDADGNTGVIQRHPAAAGLLWAMAAEQVVTHRAQHTQLRTAKHTVGHCKEARLRMDLRWIQI